MERQTYKWNKIRFIQFAIVINLLFLLTIPTGISQMMPPGSGNKKQIYQVSNELKYNETIKIDGKSDPAWINASEETYTTQNGITVDFCCLHDQKYLYFKITPQVLLAKETVNETLTLYLTSSEGINNTTEETDTTEMPNVERPDLPRGNFTGGGGPPPPPGDDDFTYGGFTPGGRAADFDLGRYEDIKLVTIRGDFVNLTSTNYTVSRRDAYVYQTGNSADPYEIERDLDQRDFSGNASMTQYERCYEFRLALIPNDEENDVNINDTKACMLSIGLLTSSNINESISSFIVQLYEPVNATKETELGKYAKYFMYTFYVMIFLSTIIGGVMMVISKKRIKNPSIINSFKNVHKRISDEERYGRILTKKERRAINAEEKQFEASLEIKKSKEAAPVKSNILEQPNNIDSTVQMIISRQSNEIEQKLLKEDGREQENDFSWLDEEDNFMEEEETHNAKNKSKK